MGSQVVFISKITNLILVTHLKNYVTKDAKKRLESILRHFRAGGGMIPFLPFCLNSDQLRASGRGFSYNPFNPF